MYSSRPGVEPPVQVVLAEGQIGTTWVGPAILGAKVLKFTLQLAEEVTMVTLKGAFIPAQSR